MRARSLKPGFFTNEHLLECSPLARILFAGLWCMADRRGRLEDRPKQIKVKILPCESVEVETLLGELAAQTDADGSPALIIRYAVNGRRYIAVKNFERHQNPHYRELESSIPGPNEADHISMIDTKAQGQPRASLGLTLGQPQASPGPAVLTPDSGLLTPDSGLLTPPSPLRGIPGDPPGGVSPSSAAGASDGNGDDPNRESDESFAVDPCPHQAIIALYHQLLPELPAVREWTPKRRKLLRARWKEKPERQTLTWWRNVFFADVRASPYLLGQVNPAWCANLEWLLQPRNFVKVLERHYARGHPNGGEDGRLSKAGQVTAKNMAELLAQKEQQCEGP